MRALRRRSSGSKGVASPPALPARDAAYRSIMRALLLAVCLASSAGAQSVSASVSALPATGVDFTAIDAFYRVADVIVTGQEPSLEAWHALMATPGYQLLLQQNQVIRQTFMNALAPSRKGERDAMLAEDTDAALALRHIIRAHEQKASVLRMRDELTATIGDSITASLMLAGKFLPAGHANRAPPPFIGFAIFGNDGYSVDGGVLLDALFVADEGLVPLLAHEFHHALASRLDRTIRPQFGATPPPDATLVMPLIQLRTEGIADLIDKPHPLPPRDGPLAWYAPRYNDFYTRSPAILKSIDSLLVVVRDDSTAMNGAATTARKLLWSNSHPTGAFMARTILDTFGTDSLMPALYNPFAFLRAFSSAQIARGKRPAFSGKALELLTDMERRYIAR